MTRKFVKPSISGGGRVGAAFQMALVVKNTSASAGDIRDAGWIPGSGRPLEEDMATHSSILAWEIPWIKGPCGRKESDTTKAAGHGGGRTCLAVP